MELYNITIRWTYHGLTKARNCFLWLGINPWNIPLPCRNNISSLCLSHVQIISIHSTRGVKFKKLRISWKEVGSAVIAFFTLQCRQVSGTLPSSSVARSPAHATFYLFVFSLKFALKWLCSCVVAVVVVLWCNDWSVCSLRVWEVGG